MSEQKQTPRAVLERWIDELYMAPAEEVREAIRAVLAALEHRSAEWDAVVAALGPHAHPGLSPGESVAQVVAALHQARDVAGGAQQRVLDLEAERDAAQRDLVHQEDLTDRQRGRAEEYGRTCQERERWDILLKQAEAERDALRAEVGRLKTLTVSLANDVGYEYKERAEQAEEALTQIAAWSWDSGSTPAPEVVSRIYCEARAVLRDSAPEGEPMSETPTARELLDGSGQWAGGLLVSRVEAVIARHRRQTMMTAGCVRCIECGDQYPCATVRILDGKE